METTGGRVRLLRARRGLSQTQLAAKAGISRNHLWRIEKGDRPKVGADVLARIASALGVSLSDLLDESAPGEPYEVIGGRAELAPEVADLAQQIDELPESVRATAVGLMAQLVALLEQQAPATVSERDRRLLEVFADLPAEDQAALQELADQLAARRADDGAATGATRSA